MRLRQRTYTIRWGAICPFVDPEKLIIKKELWLDAVKTKRVCAENRRWWIRNVQAFRGPL